MLQRKDAGSDTLPRPMCGFISIYGPEGTNVLRDVLAKGGDKPAASFAMLCDGGRCNARTARRFEEALGPIVKEVDRWR